LFHNLAAIPNRLAIKNPLQLAYKDYDEMFREQTELQLAHLTYIKALFISLALIVC